MTKPLSSAAQAVLDAPTRAAALRALADQVVPDTKSRTEWEERQLLRRNIPAIATELGAFE